VKINRTTGYALYAAVEMALADGQPVTLGQVAERNHIPEGALAKVLQQLVRSGLALGTRGVGGGYRLARPGRQITVQDVIEVFEPRAARQPRGGAAPSRVGPAGERIRALFDEVDELVLSTFESITLDTLARWE